MLDVLWDCLKNSSFIQYNPVLYQMNLTKWPSHTLLNCGSTLVNVFIYAQYLCGIVNHSRQTLSSFRLTSLLHVWMNLIVTTLCWLIESSVCRIFVNGLSQCVVTCGSYSSLDGTSLPMRPMQVGDLEAKMTIIDFGKLAALSINLQCRCETAFPVEFYI